VGGWYGFTLNWFYPAILVLFGAHYLPCAFLSGMRMFAVLAALLVGGGLIIVMYGSRSFSAGAWCTGATLLVFAGLGEPLRNMSAEANNQNQQRKTEKWLRRKTF
jgi:hypothetical protein